MRQLLEHGHSSLLVAEIEGRVVGSLIVGWDGWRGSLYRLAVEQAQRRSGVASRLVEEGERLLRDHGARRISAIVGDSEEAAIALWESVGYERDPEVGRYVKNL